MLNCSSPKTDINGIMKQHCCDHMLKAECRKGSSALKRQTPISQYQMRLLWTVNFLKCICFSYLQQLSLGCAVQCRYVLQNTQQKNNTSNDFSPGCTPVWHENNKMTTN
uniref:PPUP8014 n=1 Tax=Poeciliopsis prolifica TaxID=188132 RepID=A0A0S7EQU9_9TELE